MSFGFSIGDIISLTKIAARAYHGWKNACGDYCDITAEVLAVDAILDRLEAEARSGKTLFTSDPEDLKWWRHLSTDIDAVVQDLNDLLRKYRSLGSDRRRNWDRLRMSFEDHERIRQRLRHKTDALLAFLDVLGIRAQARVYNTIFPDLKSRIDDLALQMRVGNGTVRSDWTTHEDDDKHVWRQFRSDLLAAGFKHTDVKRYSPALKMYLGRLARSGQLDEETPPSEGLAILDPTSERRLNESGCRSGPKGSYLVQRVVRNHTIRRKRTIRNLRFPIDQKFEIVDGLMSLRVTVDTDSGSGEEHVTHDNDGKHNATGSSQEAAPRRREATSLDGLSEKSGDRCSGQSKSKRLSDNGVCSQIHATKPVEAVIRESLTTEGGRDIPYSVTPQPPSVPEPSTKVDKSKEDNKLNAHVKQPHSGPFDSTGNSPPSEKDKTCLSLEDGRAEILNYVRGEGKMPRSYRTSLSVNEFWDQVLKDVVAWRKDMERLASEESRILCAADWDQRLTELCRLERVLLKAPSAPNEALEKAQSEKDYCRVMCGRAGKPSTKGPGEQSNFKGVSEGDDEVVGIAPMEARESAQKRNGLRRRGSFYYPLKNQLDIPKKAQSTPIDENWKERQVRGWGQLDGKSAIPRTSRSNQTQTTGSSKPCLPTEFATEDHGRKEHRESPMSSERSMRSRDSKSTVRSKDSRSSIPSKSSRTSFASGASSSALRGLYRDVYKS